MSVFVAEVCLGYEGCEVVGVFSTNELAKSACDGEMGDSWVVTEFDLDSTEPKSFEVRHYGGDWVTGKDD